MLNVVLRGRRKTDVANKEQSHSFYNKKGKSEIYFTQQRVFSLPPSPLPRRRSASKLTIKLDGVEMGSSLGPLMVNAFLFSIEEKLDNKIGEVYRRYSDDTFATMKNVPAAEDFLSALNSCHPSINFTMELPSDNELPFVGMEVLKKGCKLETSVYQKPSNTSLLLHHQSHIDKRYKKSLLKTMLHRAFHLSSKWESFKSECDHLTTFANLKYPDGLINSTSLTMSPQ